VIGRRVDYKLDLRGQWEVGGRYMYELLYCCDKEEFRVDK